MSISINVKRIFLSFAQEYYKLHKKLVWNVDPRLTKIFIADKYAIDPEIVESMPAIILSIGSRSWMMSSIGQRLETSLATNVQTRTDVSRGLITYNCLSKNGIEAEEIADNLFNRLTAYREEFKKHGLYQILGITIGEEQVIRGSVSIRLSLVPVHVQYAVQPIIKFEEDLTSIFLYDNTGKEYYESLDYAVVSGQYVEFYAAPSGISNLYADYLGKITLTKYVKQSLTGPINGINRIFDTAEDMYSDHVTVTGITSTI